MTEFIPTSSIAYCADCNKAIVKPRRKCNACRKTKKYSTTSLKTSNARPRSLCVSKPNKRRTKRAKRQNPEVMNVVPYMRTSSL